MSYFLIISLKPAKKFLVLYPEKDSSLFHCGPFPQKVFGSFAEFSTRGVYRHTCFPRGRVCHRFLSHVLSVLGMTPPGSRPKLIRPSNWLIFCTACWIADPLFHLKHAKYSSYTREVSVNFLVPTYAFGGPISAT